MDWLKEAFPGFDYSCAGALVRLACEDHYLKKTEFLAGSLNVHLNKREIVVKNEDFDPEQDQVPYMVFLISNYSNLAHYTVSDDEREVHCIRWVNLQCAGPDRFYAFELENPSDYLNLLNCLSKIAKIKEEGHRESKTSPDSKRNIELLKVTTQVVPSDISKPQIKPDIPEEETKSSSIQFKRDGIAYLSPLYTPDMILFMSSADLYLLGPNLTSPILTDAGIAFLIIKHSDFNFSMDLVRDLTVFMRIVISERFYCYIDSNGQKFSWVEETKQEPRTWRVNLNEDVTLLEALINVARFEAEQKVPVESLSEEDQKWVKGEEKEEKIRIELGTVKKSCENEEIFDTAFGWRSQKVFAGRKGKIAIFSDRENEMQLDSCIEVPESAKHLLLQQQDTRLICLTDSLPNIVYNIDIERGQIIDEFSLNDKAFLQICHVSKLACLSDSPLFLGLSYNGMYLIDTRDQKKVVKEFTYSTAPAFSCISTTAEGFVSVGSQEGEIRLYKEIGKKASTVFSDLGGCIKSIDTSKNGSWILATTSSCLLVIKTEYEGELAFCKPLAKKKKPPRRLTLTPEDLIKHGIQELDFSPARFDIHESGDETMIITSTGKFVIIWNFANVKAGKLFDYVIKRLDDRVVKNEFKYNEENAVITYPNSVVIQNSSWIRQ